MNPLVYCIDFIDFFVLRTGEIMWGMKEGLMIIERNRQRDRIKEKSRREGGRGQGMSLRKNRKVSICVRRERNLEKE